jgi:hypothetical protein
MTNLGGKSMVYVYVASRSDGMHKIGVTGDVEKRCATLSRMLPKHRPIKVLRSLDIGHDAPLIEKVAHHGMVSQGYTMHSLEWFEASAETCIAAVDSAVQLISEIGRYGWMKRRVAARKEWLNEATRRTWQHRSICRKA